MSIAEIFETMEYGPAPESASPALRWLEERNGTTQLFIGGEWRDPAEGEYFDSDNPANHRTLARIAQGGQADVDAAVAAARAALDGWQALGGHGRARYMYALARHIQRQSRLFAVMESLDNGKPIRESRDIDIPLVARHFYHHAGWAQLMETELPGHEPVGVIGQIIPWNFPLLMLAWKIAPALAMGNTVVLKPAEFTSLTALLFADVCRDAGLPPGVVNIVTGDGRTGAMIVNHPDVDKIAFTGSTEVGRIIQREAAGSLKRVSLELGGKSPNIVLADADLDAAVKGAAMAIFYNAGQACTAGSRLLVEESIRDEFVAKLLQRASGMKAGDPLDPKTRLGPLVSEEQMERVLGYVQKGKDEGAELLTGGERVEVNGMRGYFLNPTIFDRVTPEMTIAKEEIFGPVLGITTFKDMDEAIHIANSSIYGLAAAVWTRDIGKAHRAAHRLRAGTVWINTYHNLDTASPFGGYKQSGYGRELGKYALDLYTQIKSVWVSLG